MQSQGFQIIEQLTGFISLALMLGMASYLGAAYSPKNNPGAENPGEETELLKKFKEFNPELQRGMLSYAERMRRGYRKGV